MKRNNALADSDSIEQSYLALLHFLALAKRRLFEIGHEYGLTGMQTLTLFMLTMPCPMHSLKKIFNCDASNITGLIDGLEQKGLVSRYEDKADRRIKMVKLKAKGRRLRKTLLERLTQSHNHLLAKLSPAELRTFVTLLEKLTTGEESV